MSSAAVPQDLEFDLSDFTQIFEHARSHLFAIRAELEKTKDAVSLVDRQTIGEYLNWELEAFTMPWVTFRTGSSINPPLSRNLRYLVSVMSMKQLGMLTSFVHVYESFMTLPVSPAGPWMKCCMVRTYCHVWWMRLANLKPDQRFLGTYPDCHQIRVLVADHFAQLPEGTKLVTLATLVESMSSLITQQLSTIHTECQEEGQYILKIMEDKVIEAKLVAATMLQMDTALGEDIVTAIITTEKLVKYLKKEAE